MRAGTDGRGGGAHPGRDDGFALLAVIMSLTILTLFLLAALAYSLNEMRPARASQDAKAAEQAALAGVDEYLARLNANDNYWKLGNTDTTNAAFTTDGTPIQGTGGSSSTAARYRYHLLSSAASITETGVIRLQVTGMSGTGDTTSKVKRTVTAEMKRSGLLGYVYLTDYEVVDPDLIGYPSSCARHYYATSDVAARPRTGCAEIQWGAGDTVNGPLHSNDALQINGQTNFADPQTETSWPDTNGAAVGTKTWWGTQPAPLTPNAPYYADSVSLPSSNNDLLRSVAPDIDGDSETGPGCYYTGATRIILNGTQMKVLSPSTTRSDTPAGCYTVSTPNQEQTKDIPPVIYVASSSGTCTVGAVGYPASNERYSVGSSSANAWDYGPNYACTRGTVYVSGTSSVPVTISGTDDVVVVGDLTVNSTAGKNIIGLIAGNCVWVWHPIRSGSTSELYSTPRVNTIQAAVLGLRHSFVVQNWWMGSPLGTLNVYGVIAQKFRGPVGTGTATAIVTGYVKNYVYDTRLKYTQPPYFLQASTAPYGVIRLTDG